MQKKNVRWVLDADIYRGSQVYLSQLSLFQKLLAGLSYPPPVRGAGAIAIRSSFGPREDYVQKAIGSLITHELTHALNPVTSPWLEEVLPVLNEQAYLSYEAGKGAGR